MLSKTIYNDSFTKAKLTLSNDISYVFLVYLLFKYRFFFSKYNFLISFQSQRTYTYSLLECLPALLYRTTFFCNKHRQPPIKAFYGDII